LRNKGESDVGVQKRELLKTGKGMDNRIGHIPQKTIGMIIYNTMSVKSWSYSRIVTLLPVSPAALHRRTINVFPPISSTPFDVSSPQIC